VSLPKHIHRPAVRAIYFTYKKNLQHFLLGNTAYELMPVLNSGHWSGAYIHHAKLDFTESVKNTPAGDEYSYLVKDFIPGNFMELSGRLSRLSREQHILMLIFSDDTRIVLGNTETGASFSYSQSGKSLGADIEWSFTDTEPLQKVKWIEQFFIEEGVLYERFEDGNQYNVVDQFLNISGPGARSLKYNEGTLSSN
jgi:hypothetical protein